MNYFNESADFDNTNLTFVNASECGPFLATRNEIETTDGCYVSNLEFYASSPVNGTTVECLDGDGREIGTDLVSIAGNSVVLAQGNSVWLLQYPKP